MTRVKIDKLRRFGFTNTVAVSGSFNKLYVDDRKLVKDSNLNLKSGYFSLTSFDGMFSGCENGTFTHSLVISSDNPSTTAISMFKDCRYAVIPYLDIGSSNLISCDYMFDNCQNAKLKGAKIPDSCRSATAMFRGCKTAAFNDIETFNENLVSLDSAFKNCFNGTFSKFSMPKPTSTRDYSFNYMFYGCTSMNDDKLDFDNISEYAAYADYMFYGAGTNGSESFDGSVVKFGKLTTCTSMFDSSEFSFEDTYFQFYGNGASHGYTASTSVSSVKNMFQYTSGIKERAPVIILSDDSIDGVKGAESAINGKLHGHYVIGANGISSGILDFSNAYSHSNMEVLDLRGISNNCELESLGSNAAYSGIQDFTSMCDGCAELKSIYGYIPSHGHSYKNMFRGCEKLSMDVSKLFKSQPSNWDGDASTLVQEGENGAEFASYNTTSIAGMFDGCVNIKSRNDSFDMSGLVKSVYSNISKTGGDCTDKNSYLRVLPPIMVASHNPIRELRNVNYDIDDVSERFGILKYYAFEDDPYDTMNGEAATFGLHSKYAKYVFGDGMLRFGGYFKDDVSKYFAVIIYPNRDITNGEVNNFYMHSEKYTPYVVPHNFSSIYNTDKSLGIWNTYRFDSVYAAKIFDSRTNEFIGNKFVGSYTRIYHEYMDVGGVKREITREYDMPVTYFDYSDSMIEIEELKTK